MIMPEWLDNLPVAGQARGALEQFVSQAAAHPEVEALLLYGSALRKPDPADLDFVIVLAKPEYTRFYAVHHAAGVRCEVEYVTAPALEQYLTHPHWRVGDWELDLGAKYVHGRILHDRLGRLEAFRRRLAGPEIVGVRRYLFIHHLGHAASRLRKLEATPEDQPEARLVALDFARALDAAAHHARSTYPRLPHALDGWQLAPAQRELQAAPGRAAEKAALLEAIEARGIRTLGFGELLEDCADAAGVLARLPIYHLVDYEGLRRVLAIVRPGIRLPNDLYMTLFDTDITTRR
jgi:hypothetical protein